MKTSCLLFICLSLVGCSSLILRDEDTTGQTVAKVATRSVLALPTLIWSEVFIKEARLEEEWKARYAQQSIYLGVFCENEGFAVGTPEHGSCVVVKRAQLIPAEPQRQVIMMPMFPAAQQSTYCYTSSSGRSTTCY